MFIDDLVEDLIRTVEVVSGPLSPGARWEIERSAWTLVTRVTDWETGTHETPGFDR